MAQRSLTDKTYLKAKFDKTGTFFLSEQHPDLFKNPSKLPYRQARVPVITEISGDDRDIRRPYNHPQLIRWSRQDEDLWKAAEEGQLKRVIELVNRGANVNSGNHRLSNFNFDNGALVKAMDGRYHRGRKEDNLISLQIVEELVKSGADINTYGTAGPLYVACSNGDREAVKFLLSLGADKTLLKQYTYLTEGNDWPAEGYRKVRDLIEEPATPKKVRVVRSSESSVGAATVSSSNPIPEFD